MSDAYWHNREEIFFFFLSTFSLGWKVQKKTPMYTIIGNGLYYVGTVVESKGFGLVRVRLSMVQVDFK